MNIMRHIQTEMIKNMMLIVTHFLHYWSIVLLNPMMPTF